MSGPLRIVIFGAGSTGRGHLGALIAENTDAELAFVDKKPDLIDALRAKGSYCVRLLGPKERVLTVDRATYLHRLDRDGVDSAIASADVVLTANAIKAHLGLELGPIDLEHEVLLERRGGLAHVA